MFRIICSLILMAMLAASAPAQESFQIGLTWYTMINGQPVQDYLYPVKYTIMSENDSTAWVKIHSTSQYRDVRHGEIKNALIKIINERTGGASWIDYLIMFPQHGRFSNAKLYQDYDDYRIDSLKAWSSYGLCGKASLDSAEVLYHFWNGRLPLGHSTRVDIINLDDFYPLFSPAEALQKAQSFESSGRKMILRQNLDDQYYLIFYESKF